MSENPSPFETAFRSLPEEYRAWYNSRLSFFGQSDLEEIEVSSTVNPTNVWPSSETITQPESTNNFALPTMPPFGSLASSNSSRHFFSQEPVYDDGSVEASGDHCENIGNSASNLNSWNYLYYLQLLNEVERERRSSQVSAVSVESQETENLNDMNFSNETPTESYSEKLKKGLGNETSFPFEKSSVGFSSQAFQASENKDVKQELPKQRNLGASRSFNKKNTKKKSTKEEDFVTSEEIKLENSGANNIATQSEGNYCEACNKSSPNAALNNTLPQNSCPSGIKCPLNVNNLHKKAKHEIEQEEKTMKEKVDLSRDETPWKEREKKVNQNIKTKKTKGKSLPNGLRKDSMDEPDCETEIKAKRKGFSIKGRQRTDRGKLPRHSGSRKRHSNDTEKESFLDHFVSLYSFICAAINHAGTQPWFKYTVDGAVSLFGVVVGSLCVFGMIAWEGFKAFKSLCSSYAVRGYEWLKLNSLSIVHTIFLKTPGLSSYASKAAMKLNENSKFEKLPSNGIEAVERLLKLKGQDPYLILGVTPDCTDEDIKKRYKTQAVMVHPDKNHFPGAEEAFKILASAFEILGNTDKRAEFDKENNVKRKGNEEMASFLERIQKNIEEIQSILGCRSCGKSHKRYKTEKQADSARYCASCKTHHAARIGDLWAETSMFGFKWHYYAYLENEIYDVTEWVTCQTDLMSTVEANTHTVPCRLATPKNKNRTSAHSRMEDLKDLVNDLLNKSRQGNQENAFTATSGGPDKSNEGKSGKTRKQGGTTGGRRRK